MTSINQKLGSGYSASVPAEQQLTITRSDYAADGTKTGILNGHGAGGRAATALLNTGSVSGPYPYGYPSMSKIAQHLAMCGWPVLSPDLGGDTAGNDLGVTRSAEGKAYLQSTMGAKAGPFIYWGWSEGGLDALTYALAHPTDLAAMVLFEPACDLNDIVVNNRGGNAALVNAAYSGGYSDVRDGPSHSPIRFASQLTTPTLIFYASDDPVVIPSTVESVISQLGSHCTVGSVLTGGHSEAAIQKIDPQQISKWLYQLGL